MSAVPEPRPAIPAAPTEACLRCGGFMDWRHQTWQCPACGFKLGCCEGETGDCTRDVASARTR